MSTNENDKSFKGVMLAILFALLAGGTTPWWWSDVKEYFDKNTISTEKNIPLQNTQIQPQIQPQKQPQKQSSTEGQQVQLEFKVYK